MDNPKDITEISLILSSIFLTIFSCVTVCLFVYGAYPQAVGALIGCVFPFTFLTIFCFAVWKDVK